MPRAVKPWCGKTDDAMPPPNVTLRIFARAKGCCQHCLRKLMAGEKWHRDHILALADGGANVETNFQVLCEPCHGPKTVAENIARAKVRAQTKAAFGIKTPPSRPLRSPGFAKKPKRVVESLPGLPPKVLFIPTWPAGRSEGD